MARLKRSHSRPLPPKVGDVPFFRQFVYYMIREYVTLSHLRASFLSFIRWQLRGSHTVLARASTVAGVTIFWHRLGVLFILPVTLTVPLPCSMLLPLSLTEDTHSLSICIVNRLSIISNSSRDISSESRSRDRSARSRIQITITGK